MKKQIKVITIFIFSLIIVNCNVSENKKIDGKYSQFIINKDSNIVLLKYPISKYYFKDTELLLKKDNQDTLIYGKFDNNLKVGQWIYNFINFNGFKINWENYNFDNIRTIKDKSWEVVENNTNILEVEFNINKNTKFYLDKYDEYSKLEPIEYFNLILEQYHSKLNLDYFDYQLTYTDEPCLFIKTKYNENDKKYLMFDYVKKINGIFYNFTLATIDISNELYYNFLFLEVIQNTEINSNKILNPFKKIIIKKFER